MARGIRRLGRGGRGRRTRRRRGRGPRTLAARAARRASADPAPPGAHALVVGRAPRRLLRAARLPRRQRARPRASPSTCSAAIPRADIGRLTKMHGQAVSGRACAEVALELGRAGAARRGGARQARRGDRGRGPARLRARARLGLRGRDRRLLPASRLRDHRPGDGRARSPTRSRSRPSGCSTSSRRCRSASPARARAYATRSPAESGPPHDRVFEVARASAASVVGQGSGRSKKAAEQAAAERRARAARRSEAPRRVVRPAREASRSAPTADASELDHDQGLQVLPRAHQARLLAWRQRDRRAERLRQVERHRRRALGARRAEPARASAASRCRT